MLSMPSNELPLMIDELIALMMLAMTVAVPVVAFPASVLFVTPASPEAASRLMVL